MSNYHSGRLYSVYEHSLFVETLQTFAGTMVSPTDCFEMRPLRINPADEDEVDVGKAVVHVNEAAVHPRSVRSAVHSIHCPGTNF